MNQTFRLSRIRAPRGNISAVALLIVFFVIVGWVLSAAAAGPAAPAPSYFDDTGLAFVNWLLRTWGA